MMITSHFYNELAKRELEISAVSDDTTMKVMAALSSRRYQQGSVTSFIRANVAVDVVLFVIIYCTGPVFFVPCLMETYATVFKCR